VLSEAFVDIKLTLIDPQCSAGYAIAATTQPQRVFETSYN